MSREEYLYLVNTVGPVETVVAFIGGRLDKSGDNGSAIKRRKHGKSQNIKR